MTVQNVIPIYSSNQSDPRNTYPELPARPVGERPEPEPASVGLFGARLPLFQQVLALQAFQNGGVPELGSS